MSRMGLYAFRDSGLLNVQAPDLGELAFGINRDRRASYCNGACATGSYALRGVLVAVGEKYESKCPKCGSTKMLHDTVTPKVAAAFAKKKRAA